jgi:hypothetical protein
MFTSLRHGPRITTCNSLSSKLFSIYFSRLRSMHIMHHLWLPTKAEFRSIQSESKHICSFLWDGFTEFKHLFLYSVFLCHNLQMVE